MFIMLIIYHYLVLWRRPLRHLLPWPNTSNPSHQTLHRSPGISLSASASLVGEGSGVRYPRFKLFSFTAFRTSSNATWQHWHWNLEGKAKMVNEKHLDVRSPKTFLCVCVCVWSPLDVPHRVRPKVFSQNTGLKPMGPTYFGQNENLWFDMSHLGDGFVT